MNEAEKKRQLKRHKLLATGLFLLMLVIYIITVYISRTSTATWIGYVKAFSEAAMVGALADWFAVTALFHHPLGIPIPHTNLIENSKRSIGDNLGNFVVTNFLTATTIRPYIQKLTVSTYAGDWLQKEKNKKALVTEVVRLLNDIIQRADDEAIAVFMAKKGTELLNTVQLHSIMANGLQYFLDKNEHEKLITLLAEKIKGYISENGALVKEKVKKESYFFIPGFVDNKLAEKITTGLANYFEEIELDKTHRVREDIAQQLQLFINNIQTDLKWEAELQQLKNGLLPVEKMHQYAKDTWVSLKGLLQKELINEDSALLKYFSKSIDDFALNLNTDILLQKKIDGWVHFNAYRLILRNTKRVGALISDTVGNWKGKELSQKLELEVGKDLQFIRINGTIVGGLVGLFIHIITMLV